MKGRFVIGIGEDRNSSHTYEQLLAIFQGLPVRYYDDGRECTSGTFEVSPISEPENGLQDYHVRPISSRKAHGMLRLTEYELTGERMKGFSVTGACSSALIVEVRRDKRTYELHLGINAG